MSSKPKPAAAPVHDPALVAVFNRSRKTYERNREELLAKLDAAAQRTRTAMVAKSDARKKSVIINTDVSPINAGAPPMETIPVRKPKALISTKVANSKELKMSA